MIKIFGYGDEISSSLAIESSFRKLKTVTFKNIPLPTDLEQFLENHIKSNKGAALIRSATKSNDYNISSLAGPNHLNINDEDSTSSIYLHRENSLTLKTVFDDNNENSPLALKNDVCPLILT